MEIEVTNEICCPYCGQCFEVMVDTTTPSQEFITDCEICCRPFAIVAQCEPGQVVALDFHPA